MHSRSFAAAAAGTVTRGQKPSRSTRSCQVPVGQTRSRSHSRMTVDERETCQWRTCCLKFPAPALVWSMPPEAALHS